MRRFLMLLAASTTMLVVFASSAIAQQYPPDPGPAEGLTPGSAPAAGARAGELAFTGSDLLPLIWIGLAVLVLGAALIVAARRRAAIRGRRISEAIA
ncbi:MAG: LPXTG cell wall anchor domain-containing protein [Acidimicrobiia bacterium]